jgi:DNA-directed RNA polymerase specialized sigma24 family protein
MEIRIETSDTALVREARQGDKSAFTALISRHDPLLLNLCRRVLRDPVLGEDAAQDIDISDSRACWH